MRPVGSSSACAGAMPSAASGARYDRAVPSFLVKEGPLGGGRLEVESQIVLGRGAADVVIDDPAISRRHALVRAVGGLVEIDDLDSLNGTWVNGRRIEATTQLQPGDVVRLGSSVLELEAPQRLVVAVPAPTHARPTTRAHRPGPLPRVRRRAAEQRALLLVLRRVRAGRGEPG